MFSCPGSNQPETNNVKPQTQSNTMVNANKDVPESRLEEIKRRRAAHRNRKSSIANLPIEGEEEDNGASKLPKKKSSCVYNAELSVTFGDGNVVTHHVRYTPLDKNACKLELSLRTAYVIPGETFESDNHPSWATSSMQSR